MKYDVVAIGEAVVDFTPAGTSAMGNLVYESQPGGAPCNMLVEAARLGGKTALLGKLGDDPLGRSLIKILEAESIDVKGICMTQDVPTGLTLVELDEAGERSFFSVQNIKSYETLTADDLKFEILDDAAIFYAGGAMLGKNETFRTVGRALDYLKNEKTKGTITCCDLNWRPFQYGRKYAQETILPLLVQFDILKLSEAELELLVGTDDQSAGMEKLRDMGVKLIVVTMGREGCYYSFDNGKGHIPAYRTKVVDTNAAGDIFTGAMLKQISDLCKPVGEISESELRKILEFANAAGSACAAKSGALLSAPTIEEIEKTQRETAKYGDQR